MSRKIYIEHGQSGEFGLNYSAILTALIKEAAQCEHYASDLFIDWRSVTEFLEDPAPGKRVWWFGFRDMGVDGKVFIKATTGNPGCYGKNRYRVIYALLVWKDEDGNAVMRLDCVYRRDVATAEK